MKGSLLDRRLHVRDFIKYLKISVMRSAKFEPKVICIGFNKTGTTSMGHAFSLLGLKNCSFNRYVFRNLYKKGKLDKLLKFSAKLDAFDDFPWIKTEVIQLMDQTFPNSKFVNTVREEEAWKVSNFNFTKKSMNIEVDNALAWKGYLNHQKFINNYFKNRPEDILNVSIKDPDGFQKLSKFLGIPTNHSKFPHANKGV